MAYFESMCVPLRSKDRKPDKTRLYLMNARMISCQVRAYAVSRATLLFLVLLQSKGTCQGPKKKVSIVFEKER